MPSLQLDVPATYDVETKQLLPSGSARSVPPSCSRRLIAVCVQTVGLDAVRVKIEFTQHAGDEVYHPQLGGFNREWEGDES